MRREPTQIFYLLTILLVISLIFISGCAIPSLNQGNETGNKTEGSKNYAYYKCYQADVWWFNQKNKPAEIKEVCAEGCVNTTVNETQSGECYIPPIEEEDETEESEEEEPEESKETITRTATYSEDESAIILVYTAEQVEGVWSAEVTENIDGGCTFKNGEDSDTFTMLSKDGTRKILEININDAETCTFSGTYQFTIKEKDLASKSLSSSPEKVYIF